MNKGQHIFFTFIFTLIVGLIFIDQDYYITMYICSILGTLTPDILEPPVHWTHRKNLHSIQVLVVTFILFLIFALINIAVRDVVLVGFGFFFFGYATHLLMDWTTKVGLPKWK